jgi:hypothetical protein
MYEERKRMMDDDACKITANKFVTTHYHSTYATLSLATYLERE